MTSKDFELAKKRSQRGGNDEDATIANTIHEVVEFAELGPYLGTAFKPTVTSREIIVWYSDVRQFTNYCNSLKRGSQERLIEHFLRTYLVMYPTAHRLATREMISEAVPSIAAETKGFKVEGADPHSLSHLIDRSAWLREVLDLSSPSSFKSLGDGMLVVWELDAASSVSIKSLLSRFCVEVVRATHSLFNYQFAQPEIVAREFYGDSVSMVRLGSGIARGQAFRLDSPSQALPDYAGPVVNLGSRLCDVARPEGIVAQLDVSRGGFFQAFRARQGQIWKINGLRGMESEQIDVFTEGVTLERSLRPKPWNREDVPGN